MDYCPQLIISEISGVRSTQNRTAGLGASSIGVLLGSTGRIHQHHPAGLD